MKVFTLTHTNSQTGAKNTVEIVAPDANALGRLFNAMTEFDPHFSEDGDMTFIVPGGHLTIERAE